MIKESQSILNQILQIVKDTNVRNLIRKQIEQIQEQHTTIFVNKERLFLRIKFAAKEFSFAIPDQHVVFLIKIKKGFPLSAPRVYMQSSLFAPTTFDIRDYLKDIIDKDWNYSIRLKQIQQKIPAFVEKLNNKRKDHLFIQKIGYFYLGQFFSCKLLNECKGVQLFIGFCQLQDSVVMDYLAISDCHIVILRPVLQPVIQEGKLKMPDQQKIDDLRLISYADIQSISQIKLFRGQSSEVQIVLKSQRLKKMVAETFYIKLHYRVVKMKQMVKKILKNIPKIQNVQMIYQTAKKDDFLDMQNSIRIAENNLKKYFNKQNINILNRYYQNAVQYLSGNANPAYVVYLNKITQLSLRQDVKLVASTDN